MFQDDQALRYSLLIISLLATSLAVLLLLASLRPYRESVERVARWGVAAT